ncbi:MAG: hypothetical protein WC701_10615 [Kiritimatiellales bacterium]|jgi:hypothetical protein
MKKYIRMMIALSFLLAATVNADSVMNYYDNFNGPGSTDLESQMPAIGPVDQVWKAHASLSADGSFTGGMTGCRNGFLAFTPESGKIYMFSTDAAISNPDKTNKNWVAIALTGSADISGAKSIAPVGNSAGAATLLLSRNGQGQALLKNGMKLVTFNPAKTSATLALELNTRKDLWSVRFLVDGSEVASGTFTANPVISHIAIGQSGTSSGKFSNLSLTVSP